MYSLATLHVYTCSGKQIQKLAKELDQVCYYSIFSTSTNTILLMYNCLHDQVTLDKSTIGWELEELEQAAHLVAAEDAEEEEEGEEGAESGSVEDIPSDVSEGVSLEESSEQNQSMEHDREHCVADPVEEQNVQEHPQPVSMMTDNAALSSATGSSTVSEDGITKLSHGLETLLTLNSSAGEYSRTKKRLIEEL